MQITLIRHAKVLIDSSIKLSAKEMKKWIGEYNHAPIDTTFTKLELIEHIKNSNYFITSSLPRAKGSLELIGIKEDEQNSLFDEIELTPFYIPYIKLKPKTWLLLNRLYMFLKIKPILNAKKRAKLASEHLLILAKKHQNIALLGHGAMNWLIAKELEKVGFKGIKEKDENSNWGYRILSNNKELQDII